MGADTGKVKLANSVIVIVIDLILSSIHVAIDPHECIQ